MAKDGKVRKLGPEAMGGGGDLRDRMRNVYKPGSMKPIPSPTDSVEAWVKKQMGEAAGRKERAKAMLDRLTFGGLSGKVKKPDPTSAVRPKELPQRLPTPRPVGRAKDPTSAVRDDEFKLLKRGRKK